VRIIYGARVTIIIGFIASLMNLTVGVLYGGISGYLGGVADNIMMRIVDILRSIPRLLYVILLMVVFGSGLLTVVIVIGLVDWLGMARIVRGQVLSIKNREYVLAAKALGAKPKRILLRHLIPNAMGPIIIETAMNIPAAIFTEAFLSFVGLGVSAPQASWGTLANNALSGFMSFPYEMFFPAIAISLTVLAFNFLGDGLRDAIDPRFKE
jgi:oligopeptide transport system permease protein